MKKKKSNYITDLTYEILTNKILLDEWAEYSKDLEFLELSTEILSDTDLLFNWDCNNILNLKLSSVRSEGREFELKNGMIIQVDESFNILKENADSYRKSIDAMIKKKAYDAIVKEDLVQQGYTVAQIKNAEHNLRMKNMAHSIQYMNQYSLPSQMNLFSKAIPVAIDRFKKDAKVFYKRKADEILFSGSTELEIKTNLLEVEKDTEKSNFNRNNWNQECFELFNFLIGNYEKKGKVKFINIYYFLKNKTDKNVYVFTFTIDQYKLLISSNYEIQFKTFKVAEYDFEEKEVPLLLSFEQDFRKRV
jgi:hypothetical protein